MKKVLITGGGHSEIPLIEAAKKLGYYVLTTGNDPGGLGHKKSDKYVKGDYSDKEEMLQIAVEENVSAVISGCNDFAYLSTAYVCEKLDLPGHDCYQTARIIHHKNEFRKCLSSLEIRAPKAITCRNKEDVKAATEIIGYPLVVKAVDLTGGKGVNICSNYAEVEIAYKIAQDVSREKNIILEEFIEGSNHGASVLLKDQKIVFGFIDNEQYYINKYLVSGACSPTSINAEQKKRLFSDIEKVAKYLMLEDGLFHTQFIISKDKYPIMIDPCRRTPGDLYVKLVQYATEVCYAEEIVKAELGMPLQQKYYIKEHNIARECLMTDHNGRVETIELSEQLEKYVFEKFVWAKEGDLIEDYTKYKAGIIFFECENVKKHLQLVEKFQTLIKLN